MLKKDEAVEKLKTLRSSSAQQRAYFDSFWSLAGVYTYADQWAYIAPKDNALSVSYLRNITDPRREDIRVTMNRIHADVTRLVSELDPMRIDYELVQRSVRYLVPKLIGKRFFDKYLKQVHALEILSEKNWARFIIGSMIVRRTLTAQGAERFVAGGEKRVRNFQPGVALTYPSEMLRDPSASTTNMARDEEIVAQEKPRTTNWLKRYFGADVKTQSKLGQLLRFQRQFQAAGGLGLDRHATASTLPAVLVQETYYQDPDEVRPWAWAMFSYCDPSVDRDRVIPLGKGLVKNPFFGLPFHPYHYDTQIASPWGRGAPHIQIAGQDILNIAITWLVRNMQAGSGKWMVEKNTMSPPEKARMLNNRLDEVIEYTKQNQYSAAPQRTPPTQVSPAVLDFINGAPTWMKDSLNLSDVQSGKTSKRGESGGAIELKLNQANAPLEMVRRRDDRTTEDLLMGLYCDVLNPRWARLDQVREVLGEDTPDEMVRALLRDDPKKYISHVNLLPSTNRPKTPSEQQQEITTLHGQGVIDNSEDALWELMLRGVNASSDMKNAHDKQLMEINQMLHEGEYVPVYMAENHGYEKRTVAWFVSQPAAMALTEEDRELLTQHYNDHYQAEMAEMQGQQMMQGSPEPGRPSPPSEAFRGSDMANAGAVAPAAQM